uniref:N-acyl-aliphatic-L-amino acid amidohydrolase n=1 Tax=Phallusia mammillata TaxID=59560 RepID=A0A6F9D6J4_9ASCI|nr:aminoacylase-1 [Phallusia mammillata]
MESPAVTKFREYIRIKSVHPKPDYDSAVAFLDQYGKDIGLEVHHVEVSGGGYTNIVVIMTWKGKNPNLCSVLLHSHTDVVPVYEDQWKCDAFAAIKDENGDIYGRGTQDMKCVGIQYLEAIRRLKKEGKQFERDIHLTFMPDEEIGGICGIRPFVKTKEFADMNVGFALDEGLAHPENKYSVFYGERGLWWIRIKCEGNPGHGSRFIENTAAEKMRKIVNKMLDFREKEKLRLEANNTCLLGDVTTVNLTKLEGGLAYNIVPADLTVGFDIRIAPTINLKEFENQVATWCKEAGDGVTYSFVQKNDDQTLTPHDKSDPWWNAFSTACEEIGVELSLEVFPAGTDSKLYREAGYPAIGFSPMRNTPILLHDHNEFLNEKIFMEGIDAYCKIIPALANVPEY